MARLPVSDGAVAPIPAAQLPPPVPAVVPADGEPRALRLVPEAASLAEQNWETTIKPFAGVNDRRIRAGNVLTMLQQAYSDLWRVPGGSGSTTLHFKASEGSPTWRCSAVHGTPHPEPSPGDYLVTDDGTVYEYSGGSSATQPVASVREQDGTYVITSLTPNQTTDHQPGVLSLV